MSLLFNLLSLSTVLYKVEHNWATHTFTRLHTHTYIYSYTKVFSSFSIYIKNLWKCSVMPITVWVGLLVQSITESTQSPWLLAANQLRVCDRCLHFLLGQFPVHARSHLRYSWNSVLHFWTLPDSLTSVSPPPRNSFPQAPASCLLHPIWLRHHHPLERAKMTPNKKSIFRTDKFSGC